MPSPHDGDDLLTVAIEFRRADPGHPPEIRDGSWPAFRDRFDEPVAGISAAEERSLFEDSPTGDETRDLGPELHEEPEEDDPDPT